MLFTTKNEGKINKQIMIIGEEKYASRRFLFLDEHLQSTPISCRLKIIDA